MIAVGANGEKATILLFEASTNHQTDTDESKDCGEDEDNDAGTVVAEFFATAIVDGVVGTVAGRGKLTSLEFHLVNIVLWG